MDTTELSAIIAISILALLMCLQMLLVAGLPLGRLAWGGQYRVLPVKLRWGSLLAVVTLGVAAWVVLARADLVAPGDEPLAIQIITWVLTGYWGLNTFGNIVSKSPAERYVMTPVSVLLIACFVVVALS